MAIVSTQNIQQWQNGQLRGQRELLKFLGQLSKGQGRRSKDKMEREAQKLVKTENR